MRPDAPDAWVTGRILQWDAPKGLGFVRLDAGGSRLVLRRADLGGRLRTREPEPEEAVRVRVQRDAKGQPTRVREVQTLRPMPRPARRAERQPRPAPSPPPTPQAAGSQRLLVIPAFALVLGLLHLSHPLPRPVPLLYGALSTALFIVYGLDKRAARQGQARVPEATLHLLALLGGWPGALLGQHIFRHKTQKPRFLGLTWAMVALNLLVLVMLASPLLRAELQRWLPFSELF